MRPPGTHRPRTLLAHLLHERRWTTEDFRRHYAATARSLPDGQTLTVSERQAKRWLSGTLTGQPYPAACRVLEKMFACSVDDLIAPYEPTAAGSFHHPTSTGDTAVPPMLRDPAPRLPDQPYPRHAIGQRFPPPEQDDQPGGLIMTVAADAGDALRFVDRAENATSPEILTLLWNETQRLTRTYGAGLTWMVDDLIAVRRAVFRLLDSPAHPGQARDLYFLGGIVCSMLAHSSRDLGRPGTSLIYQKTALLCADRAGHPGLRIVVRTEQAATAYWMGRYSESVRFAQLATADIVHVRGSITVLPAVQEARAWAAVGNTELTRAALDRGRDIRERITTDDLDEIGGMMSCSLPEQLGIVAGTAAWLPDAAMAEQAANEAVTALTNAPPADRSFNSEAIARADLALARIRQRALDGALDAVRPILQIPEERRVLPIRASVQRLHQALADPVFHGSPAVQEIAAEIEAFCGLPSLTVG